MESPQPLQAAPPAGRLEDVSALQLYYLIAVSGTSGLLVLGESQDTVRIWFKQGTPHAVQSEVLGLGQYLVEQRVLTTAALAGAKPHIARLGGDVASGLFAAGLLNPSTAFPLIQQHAQAVLQRGLLLETGPFAFDPSAPVPASGFQLGSRWQLLAAAARRIDPLSLELRLRDHLQEAPSLAGSTIDLALTAQETRLLGQLDGSRTLEELIEQAGALEDGLRRLLVLLQEIDRLTWGPATGRTQATTSPDSLAPPPPSLPPAPPTPAAGARPVTPPPVVPTQTPPNAPAPPAPAPAPKKAPAIASPPVAAKAAKPPPATPTASATKRAAPASPATKSPGSRPPSAAPVSKAPQRSPGTVVPLPLQYVANDILSLTKLLAQLGKKDCFGRLNVARSRAQIPGLKASYLQLAKVYHPDTVPPEAPPEMRKLKADVLSLFNEAYATLADDRRRTDYIDELEAKEQVGDLDVQAILAAEEDFQRATLLAKARKYPEAMAVLESCIQMNPKEGEFYAWRGFCRFFGAQDKRALRNAVLEDLLRALELSPRCTVAWLFQGQVFKLLNETQHAKQAFQKTLELEPGNVEAQRELRLYEQRKQ